MPEPSIRALFFLDVPHRLAGAQRSLLAAVERASTYGVEPLVVFPGPGRCEEAFRAAGVRTMVVPAPETLLLFGKKLLGVGIPARAQILLTDVLPYCKRLAEIASRESIDVLHFNTPRGILAAGWTAKMVERPTVLHLRGEVPFKGSYWMAAQALADRIILVARALERAIHPSVRGRARVVHNGVKFPVPADRQAARAALGKRLGRTLSADEMVFLSLSSPVPFKGLHHLLTSAALARSRGLQATYVLAGDGNDEEYERLLVTKRRDLGLEDMVHFLGFVPDPLAILPGADALVLPSVSRERLLLGSKVIEVWGSEGLPRSILEAMSVGVPVVSSDTGGAIEQVEQGVTGWLVPAGDPEAFAEALMRVAGDGGWREKAAGRAREIVAAKFTVERAASGLAEVLHDAAAGTRARGVA